MKPTVLITADGEAIGSRLISMKVRDRGGFDSDALQLVIDDRGTMGLPRHGAALDVSIGYGDELTRIGRFVADEVEVRGPPATMTVRARAADFRRSLKKKKTRGWDNVTFTELAAVIASEHGLESVVSDSLRGYVFHHIDQTRESDLAFLTRLAEPQDGAAVIKNGVLVVKERASAKGASGKALPRIEIERKDDVPSAYSLTISDREDYQAVETSYRDLNAAEEKKVVVGAGEPVHVIRRTHDSRGAALAAANAKFKKIKRGRSKLALTVPGDPRLAAEMILFTKGFRPGVDGKWLVTGADHEIDKGGYVTRIEAEVSK